MSVPTNRAHAAADRSNLYDEITGKIIVELEAGRFPWVQPWGTSATKSVAFPSAQCQHASRVQRDQRAYPLGRRRRTRVSNTELDNLSTGVRARRERPQRRARDNGRLCRSFCPGSREEARSRDGRGQATSLPAGPLATGDRRAVRAACIILRRLARLQRLEPRRRRRLSRLDKHIQDTARRKPVGISIPAASLGVGISPRPFVNDGIQGFRSTPHPPIKSLEKEGCG